MNAPTDPAGPSVLPCLVTMTEIADQFAEGSRTTVSNWRNRYPDFPPPSTPGRSPLFDAAALVAWLRSESSPLSSTVADERMPDAAWWWNKTAQALGARHPLDGRAALAGLVLLRAAALGEINGVPASDGIWDRILGSDDPAETVDAATELERENSVLAGLLHDPLVPLRSDPEALGELIGRLESAAHVAGGPRLLELAISGASISSSSEPLVTTSDDLARLLVGLGIDDRTRSVIDPACGEGRLLLTAWRTMNERKTGSPDDLQLFGQELDPGAWRIARCALLLEGATADLGESGRDSIDDDQFPSVRADLVLIDPPLPPSKGGRVRGASRTPPLVDWIGYGRSHRAPGGRAVIALPAPVVLVESQSRRHAPMYTAMELRKLAELGHVEAVAVLPRRTRSDLNDALTVWVLRDEVAQGPCLLVTTLPGSKVPTSASARSELPFEVDNIVELVRSWRGEPWDGTRPKGRIEARPVDPNDLVTAVAGSVVALDDEVLASDGRRIRAHGETTSAADEVQSLRKQIDELRKERRRTEKRIDDLVGELEGFLDDLWRDDPDTYWRIRERIDVLRKRGPGE